MTTLGSDQETTTRPRRWIAALIAVLVGLAVGIGVGFLAFSPKPMNAEVDSLVRDYVAEWDAGDGEAALALMTDDATHTSLWYPGDGITGNQIANAVNRHEPSRFEVIGDVIVAGDSAPYEASSIVRITDRDAEDNYDSFGYEFVNKYLIVDVGGQLRIQSHTTMGSEVLLVQID